MMTPMGPIIFSIEQYEEINRQLKEISSSLRLRATEPSEKIIDNCDFISLMKISKRTAQAWRDEGIISYSQIGAKIYYKLSDIEFLLNSHYVKASGKQSKY